MSGLSFLMVEPVASCNLRCPLCPTGRGQVSRGAHQLPATSLLRFFEESGVVPGAVLMWGWGEPTLNTELPDLVAVSRSRGSWVEVQSNGHGPHAAYQELLQCRVDRLTIAMDGLTRQQVEPLRGPTAQITAVMALIEWLVARSRGTEIVVQCLVTRLNEGTLSEIRRWIESRGARPVFKSLHVGDAPPAVAERLVPAGSLFRRSGKGRPGNCSFLRDGGVLLCDGSFVPCCYDWRGRHIVGRLEDGWRQVRAGRDTFAARARAGAVSLCDGCTPAATLVV